ncbi:MAG: pilus assembly protein, partial [Desulfobacterales bacterium]|nr:pilus assembly protein [Desulfobacterales bacterium]
MLIAKIRKNLRKDENGQAMVEFAVVFPVVFLLCLVIMQTFLLLSARQVVNYAAYCAARSA